MQGVDEDRFGVVEQSADQRALAIVDAATGEEAHDGSIVIALINGELTVVITSYSIHYTKLYDPVTLSIGVAVASGKNTDGEALIRAADAALYQAKQSGRNRVVANAA